MYFYHLRLKISKKRQINIVEFAFMAMSYILEE